MPVCHVCTPEEDHIDIDRNIVFIKDFAPRPLQQVQTTTSNVLNCLNNIAVIQTLLKVFRLYKLKLVKPKSMLYSNERYRTYQTDDSIHWSTSA